MNYFKFIITVLIIPIGTVALVACSQISKPSAHNSAWQECANTCPCAMTDDCVIARPR